MAVYSLHERRGFSINFFIFRSICKWNGKRFSESHRTWGRRNLLDFIVSISRRDKLNGKLMAKPFSDFYRCGGRDGRKRQVLKVFLWATLLLRRYFPVAHSASDKISHLIIVYYVAKGFIRQPKRLFCLFLPTEIFPPSRQPSLSFLVPPGARPESEHEREHAIMMLKGFPTIRDLRDAVYLWFIAL